MTEILIWVAIAVAVIAVWMLAGRSGSGRPHPDAGLPPNDPMRGDSMRGGMF